MWWFRLADGVGGISVGGGELDPSLHIQERLYLLPRVGGDVRIFDSDDEHG